MMQNSHWGREKIDLKYNSQCASNDFIVSNSYQDR